MILEDFVSCFFFFFYVVLKRSIKNVKLINPSRTLGKDKCEIT